MSDMTLMKVLRSTGLADRATVHGFRSTFRDWAAERTNTPHAVMELALAHAVGNSVEQAYARSDLLAKRRRLMDQWAAFITGGAKARKVIRAPCMKWKLSNLAYVHTRQFTAGQPSKIIGLIN